jgi:hypothetical protein
MTMKLGLRVATAAAAVAFIAGMSACGNPNTTDDLTPAADTAAVTVTTTVEQPTTVTVTAQPEKTTTASTSGAAGDGHCTLATLNVSLGEPEGAAGSSYFPLTFTNTGFEPCTLEGFPEVAYVAGDDNHEVGAPAAQNGDAGAAVTLKPGEHTVANLQEVTVQNFPEDVCDPTAVTGLRVSLTGSDEAAFIPQQDRTGCAAEELPGGQFQMSVQAFGVE